MIDSTPKILLVQLFSNGDCLYATTVARQIKKDYPNCILTWAVARFCKDITRLNPDVDEIIIVDDVPKNDIKAFRRYRRRILKEKKAGLWNEVFITMNMDRNQSLYDGTIRGMILKAYPNPITVPIQPILILSEEEKEKVKQYAIERNLFNFDHVILWEFAPQSGQSKIDFQLVWDLASRIVTNDRVCVILTSGIAFKETINIFDASKLTVRENAALTHYCTLLVGCSSGITWISTSIAAKQLPMLQLLDPQVAFLNAPSVDFDRNKIKNIPLIELTTLNREKIFDCMNNIITYGFEKSIPQFNMALPIQFKTTRKVVYNLLCYLQLGSVLRHFNITVKHYGLNKLFIKEFLLAIILFPINLLKNTIRKLFF
jgi:hypothetical protein